MKQSSPISRFSTVLMLCLVIASASFAQATQPLGGGDGKATPAPAAVTGSASGADIPDDYRLDVGDSVTIDVTRHDALSRTMRIPADGNIRLPRLNRAIPARGKTCSELAEAITERLQSEGKLVLRAGQVSVSVSDMRVRRIYVRGNAGKNGDFDLKPGWRVTELIAVSGGVTNPDRVTARLLNPNRPAPLKLDLKKILDGADSAENVSLQEGDTLTVDLPRNKRFYVKGEGPRGVYELDERFGLRQALVQIGYSTTNATGDLRHAFLIRYSTPGDPNSEAVRIPVNLFSLLTDPASQEIPLTDLDTLEIPVSLRFVYIFGQVSAPKRYFLPEDRKTYLLDVMSLGDTSGKAKIDDIKIWREENGKKVQKSYKFGKYLANADEKQNPEILPGDVIFVPDVKRSDPVSNIWTAWGFYGILQSVFPTIRP